MPTPGQQEQNLFFSHIHQTATEPKGAIVMLFKFIKGVACCTFGTVVDAVGLTAVVVVTVYEAVKAGTAAGAEEAIVADKEDDAIPVAYNEHLSCQKKTEKAARKVPVAGEAHADVRIVEVDDGFEARQVWAIIMVAGILVCRTLGAAVRFVAYAARVVGKWGGWSAVKGAAHLLAAFFKSI